MVNTGNLQLPFPFGSKVYYYPPQLFRIYRDINKKKEKEKRERQRSFYQLNTLCQSSQSSKSAVGVNWLK